MYVNIVRIFVIVRQRVQGFRLRREVTYRALYLFCRSFFFVQNPAESFSSYPGFTAVAGLKVGSNKATEEQLIFIDTINRIGGRAIIAYGSDAAIEVIKAYLDGALESLDIKSDTYPAEKAKLTDRVNTKRFIGFCGTDCRACDNMGCLGRKE